MRIFSLFSIFNLLLIFTVNAQNFIKVNGKVLEENTSNGVPYAHIIIRNTLNGTVTNNEGEFQLNVDIANQNEYVVFSSLGYSKDSVLLSILIKEEFAKIYLSIKSTMLEEVRVSGKKLEANEIISQVVKRLKSNYYQDAFNQELFYRSQIRSNDTITFNEEASVLTYDRKGYQPKSTAYSDMFGKILQLRNTTNNRSEDEWFGTGSLWKVFTHDLILDKNNILHKTSAYSIKISDVLEFDGETVYELTFTCNKPSAVTTGFGFPDPESTYGKLYVNESDFAVLKYEHCIKRKPYDYKSSNLRAEDWTVLLVQSYKKYDGKYFLHHSKQIHTHNLVNPDANTKNKITEIYDMISSAVYTSGVTVINTPINRLLKGFQFNPDPKFWNKHNIVLEDQTINSGCF